MCKLQKQTVAECQYNAAGWAHRKRCGIGERCNWQHCCSSCQQTTYNHKQILTCLLWASKPQTGWQTTYVTSLTHMDALVRAVPYAHSSRAVYGAHTITSTESKENGVGRGERDWVGGSGRKRWRKRQRESRSEWHMAFRLKKDEQHETKTRIWISKIREKKEEGGKQGKAWGENVGFLRSENGGGDALAHFHTQIFPTQIWMWGSQWKRGWEDLLKNEAEMDSKGGWESFGWTENCWSVSE